MGDMRSLLRRLAARARCHVCIDVLLEMRCQEGGVKEVIRAIGHASGIVVSLFPIRGHVEGRPQAGRFEYLRHPEIAPTWHWVEVKVMQHVGPALAVPFLVRSNWLRGRKQMFTPSCERCDNIRNKFLKGGGYCMCLARPGSSLPTSRLVLSDAALIWEKGSWARSGPL